MNCCTLCRRSLRPIVPHSSANTTLWINDEILQEVWTAFYASASRIHFTATRHFTAVAPTSTCEASQHRILKITGRQANWTNFDFGHRQAWRAQRRDGSSVPGPLEAQKRRSLLRRFVELAGSSEAGPKFDIGFMPRPSNQMPPSLYRTPGLADQEILSCE